jgi:hypothetical protein
VKGFFLQRLGGRYQAIVRVAGDLEAITAVDSSHWSANSAPVDSLGCDPVFLRMLDVDGDGRILPRDVRASVQWWMERMANKEGFGRRSDMLHLHDLNPDHPGARSIFEAARTILANFGTPQAEVIALSQIRDHERTLHAAEMRGGGVISPESAKSTDLAFFIRDVMSCVGSVPGSEGQKGIDKALLDAFLGRASRWLEWRVFSSEDWSFSPEGWQAAQAVASRLDDFFARCNRVKLGHAPFFPSPSEEWLSDAPLSIPNAEEILFFDSWINPVDRKAWGLFRAEVLKRSSLENGLTWPEWEAIWADLQAYGSWLEAEPKGGFAKVGEERLRYYLSVTSLHQELKKQLDVRAKAAEDLSHTAELERLVLLQRHLKEFINSYVNFSRFYDPTVRSMPEAGSLLMDGRWFHLAVRLENREQHKLRAKASNFFLLYVQVCPHEQTPYEVAVAVTGHHRGDLDIGKRGVFVDLEGHEHPAQVVDVLENPINLLEAFLQPLWKVRDSAVEQIDKFRLGQQVGPSEKDELASAKVSARDLVVGGGLTIAALSSALAYIVKTVSSIQLGQLASIVVLPLLLLALLSALRAWTRIRRRDLGPVLEASGWGINHPLPAPRWAGVVFTRTPPLPKEFPRRRGELLREYRRRVDPLHDEKTVGLVLGAVLFVALCCWWYKPIVIWFANLQS